MRIENAADCGSRMPFAETHRNSICYETSNGMFLEPSRNFSLATLSAYARDQPHKHAQCTSDPYPGKHHRRPALCHVPYGPANGTKRCGPSQMRRPKLIDYRACRHDEIECRHNPDPILRGGAGATDGRQQPRGNADDGRV